MKKYFHEYSEQELMTMSSKELEDIKNNYFQEEKVKPTDIVKLFHHMWTEESTILYTVSSPEFLRET